MVGMVFMMLVLGFLLFLFSAAGKVLLVLIIESVKWFGKNWHIILFTIMGLMLLISILSSLSKR